MVNIDFQIEREKIKEGVILKMNIFEIKNDTAILAVTMNCAEADDDLKIIYACQDGNSLFDLIVSNLDKPIKAGQLIYARGTYREMMGRCKLNIDLAKAGHRWVTFNPSEIQRNSGFTYEEKMIVSELSDDKTVLEPNDLTGMDYIWFRKNGRGYKLILTVLERETRDMLLNDTPHYIKGTAFARLYDIFKVNFDFS